MHMSHSISGSTQAYLIPGDPVRNVRLPRMFNATFERFGIDAVLLPMQVPVRDFAVFFKSAFLARNVRGMVIAPPHKPLVVDLLDGCGLFGAGGGFGQRGAPHRGRPARRRPVRRRRPHRRARPLQHSLSRQARC
jgi:hypothetical protein